jgi:hypothetical protein
MHRGVSKPSCGDPPDLSAIGDSGKKVENTSAATPLNVTGDDMLAAKCPGIPTGEETATGEHSCADYPVASASFSAAAKETEKFFATGAIPCPGSAARMGAPCPTAPSVPAAVEKPSELSTAATITMGSAKGPVVAAGTVDVFAAVGEVAKAPKDSVI